MASFLRPAAAILAAVLLAGTAADLAAQSDDGGEALRVGEAVLAIRDALTNPLMSEADKLAAIGELGQDSRYYSLVRGWLAQELAGAESIRSASRNPSGYCELDGRIAFLKKAIRMLDLE